MMRIDINICDRCGKCIEVCPNKAIKINPNDGHFYIDPHKCLNEGYCRSVCPKHAIFRVEYEVVKESKKITKIKGINLET